MAWTKGDIAREAYAELALASYDFDLTPDEIQWAIRRLDSMMASWGSIAVQLGYTMAATPDATDPDDDSGIPLEANLAVILKLALSIATGKGKNPPPALMANAREAWKVLLARTAHQQVRPQQLREGLPLGAGVRREWHHFVPTNDHDPMQATPGGLDFLGDH